MSRPTLSVIMPNYNHSRFLPEALQSILDQSYQPDEIIVIDDASTDNSMEILEQFARNHPRLKVIRNERNMGVVYNLNRLLELASGDYVYGMAADDKILPGFLEKSMQMLRQHPEAGLCSTLTLLMSEDGNNFKVARTPVVSSEARFFTPGEARQALERYSTWIMGNTTIYRRQALVDAGGFILELESFCDGFIQQVVVMRHGACFIPETLAAWRRMDDGYAMATSANFDRAIRIMEYANTLMRSTYADLFSPDYVDEWNHQWLYSMGLLGWNYVRREQGKFLAQWRKAAARSWFDGLFIGGLYLSIRFQQLVVLCYLVARFRLTYKSLLRQWRKLGWYRHHLSFRKAGQAVHLDIAEKRGKARSNELTKRSDTR